MVVLWHRLALLPLVGSGLGYRRIDHGLGGRRVDLLVRGEPPSTSHSLVSCFTPWPDLFDHRGKLSPVAAGVDHVQAPRSPARCRWPTARWPPGGTLHRPSSSLARRGPWCWPWRLVPCRHCASGRGHFGQLLQRTANALFAILCRAKLGGVLAPLCCLGSFLACSLRVRTNSLASLMCSCSLAWRRNDAAPASAHTPCRPAPLLARRVLKNKTVVAVARELAGFVWAIGREVQFSNWPGLKPA